MVALRLDHRLRGRIDPSDVLQEAFLQAAQAWPTYLERPEQSVFHWLRWLTRMTLQLFHRRHLGVQARDAGREVQLLDRPWPEATSAALAAQLLGRDTRPSVAAIRAERQRRLQEALNAMVSFGAFCGSNPVALDRATLSAHQIGTSSIFPCLSILPERQGFRG
jgi:RNA polymerase sigma-70 factor (ECF subfamily)